MYKKNQLKDLIYIQENKPCNEQTINGLFRSIVEPILDGSTESLVLIRLEDKSKKAFNGILKRLEFSKANVYDFSDTPIKEQFKGKLDGKFNHILKETIWDKTEFVYVLAERFGAVLIFDYQECELEGFAGFYLLHNSKTLSDSFEIINSNSITEAKEILSKFQEKNHPDRRDNETLNSSIRKIVEILNETNQEVMISELEKESAEDLEDGKDLASRLEFISDKSRYVAHEIRNQLSICDLYTSIIQKQINKVSTEESVEKSLTNALNCIQKSLKIASNSLVDLKSLNNNSLKIHDLKELTVTAVGLAKVYTTGKDIQIKEEIESTTDILVDENKFLAVLINLVKNAVESIDEFQAGEIKIQTINEEDKVQILISNNGKPVAQEIQTKIFEEGFTTKATGSGLGLGICKRSLEEQFGQLKLKKSDEESTEFEITLPKV